MTDTARAPLEPDSIQHAAPFLSKPDDLCYRAYQEISSAFRILGMSEDWPRGLDEVKDQIADYLWPDNGDGPLEVFYRD